MRGTLKKSVISMFGEFVDVAENSRRLRKRLFSPFLILGILGAVLLPVSSASATMHADSNSQKAMRASGATTQTVYGSVSGNSGEANVVMTGVGAESIPFNVSIGSPTWLPTTSGTEYSITAIVGLVQTGSIQPMSEYSGNSCGYDGSYSVYECVTMYFNIKSDAYYYFADNAQDSIQAINEDPHDVVLSTLSMTTGGIGKACNGSADLDSSQTWNFTSPSSGTTYNESPSWSGNYYEIFSGLTEFQDVTGTLHWYYRGNAESLVLSYTVPDSEPGWPTGGCSA